jgi:hypothetical protein
MNLTSQGEISELDEQTAAGEERSRHGFVTVHLVVIHALKHSERQ